MKRLDGSALINGVIFQIKGSSSKAIRNQNDQIILEIKHIEHTSDSILDKIPFIRGIFLFSSLLPIPGIIIKLFTSIIVFFLLMNVLVNTEISFGTGNKEKYFYAFFFFIGLLMITSIIFKLTPLGKYHGAEHKVFNTYSKSKFMTVNQARKQSRCCECCGTVFIIIVFSVFLLFYTIGMHLIINIFLSIAVGYEIFRLKEGKIYKCFMPVKKLGEGLQYFLFTSEPSDKELEVAIKAIKGIMKLSLSK